MADAVLRELPAAPWLCLRAAPDDAARLEPAVGLALPRRVGFATLAGDARACRLGPDEWRLLLPGRDPPGLRAALAAAGPPFALVAIGDAERGVEVSGPGALRVLAGGCPLDVGRLEPGRVTRTLFAQAEIVLTVTAAGFELSAARSVFSYLTALLARIAAERA